MNSSKQRYFIDFTGITPIILPITCNSLYEVQLTNVNKVNTNYQQLHTQYSAFGHPNCIVVDKNNHLLTFGSAQEAVKFYKNILKQHHSVQLIGKLPSSVVLKHPKPIRPLLHNSKLLNYVVQSVIHEDYSDLQSDITAIEELDIPQVIPVLDLYLMQNLKKNILIDVLVANFPVYFRHNDLIKLIESVLPQNSYFDFQTYNFNSQSDYPLFCIIYVISQDDATLLIQNLHNKIIAYKVLKAIFMTNLENLLDINR